MVEYLTFFATANERLRRKAAAHAQRILDDLRVRVVPQSRESFLSGMDLYGARPDKGYSPTDCISMQTMRRERLTQVLTNDRHFEQEVFTPFSVDAVVCDVYEPTVSAKACCHRDSTRMQAVKAEHFGHVGFR